MNIIVKSDILPELVPPISEIKETLLDRARALVPVLRARAKETENLRHLPEATVNDIRDAGFLKVTVAPQYGGYPGAEYDTMLEIAMELARGCPSTAWCYTIWQSHNLSLSAMQEETRAEYYSKGADIISSTARMVIHETMEVVDGGIKISAQYNYSSGCNYAEWFIVLTKGMIGLILKREEVEIIDNWHVMGLRGTGSHGIQVKNLFVPASRIWGLFDSATSNPPVFMRNNRFSDAVEGPLYAYTALAVVVGAAQGMIDVFTERYRGVRAAPMSDSGAGDTPAMQMRLAESSAEVDAARLMMMTDCRELLERARTSTPILAMDRARYRRNMAFVSKLCVDAANRLFDPTGGRAISDGDVLQRFFLDTLAGSHHATLPRDRLMDNYGKIALGFKPNTDHLGSLFHPMLIPDMFEM